MKALIFSDVHANFVALEAIWSQERDADAVFCAGDFVDYGPFPKEVLDWVRFHNVTCVQGNHDRHVVAVHDAGADYEALPPADRLWAHHNASCLDDRDIAFLRTLPPAIMFRLDGFQYGMTHLFREYEEIVSLHAYEAFVSAVFPAAASPVTRLVLGHTHRQAVRYLGDTRLWLNPGSASYRRPDDPDQTAHYITVTDGAISLKRLAYDLIPVRQAARREALMASEMAVTDRAFGPRQG